MTGIPDILNQLVSHALQTGLFETVNGFEPKSAPGNGITAAIWVDRIEPAPSGLNTTSIKLTFNVRIFTNMLQEPQDAIDPNVLKAVDVLMTGYSGDFDLGGLARNVELLNGWSAQAGYINIDGKLFRVMTMTVPVTVNDVWTQSA